MHILSLDNSGQKVRCSFQIFKDPIEHTNQPNSKYGHLCAPKAKTLLKRDCKYGAIKRTT